MIVRPTSVDDVVAAVRHARESQMVVSVRGGGHSVAGFSTCDGGMVIDLSNMREVTVDPARRRARVQGGALLSQLDRAAQAYGLVCPVGVVGHTGVGGLTLGGGMGRLMRKFGLTVDNLIGVNLVTAGAEPLHADDKENPDLFWGMRGAGANFGVVTSFEFQLHPLEPDVYVGAVAFPTSRSHEMAERVREFVAAHDDVHVALSFGKDPEHGPVFSVGSTYTGDVEHAERDLRVFRDARPLMDTFAPNRYVDLQGMFDDMTGWGDRVYTKSGFLGELSDAVMDQLCRLAETAPPDGELSIWAMGGAVGRVADEAMAYTGRGGAYNVSAELTWTNAADDEAKIAWGRAAMAALEPYLVTGRYVNEVADEGEEGAQVYGQAKYERLVALKRKYDPDNFFRLNQNIRPAASRGSVQG
ncbi:MAG TPA: FAD-binding oxidoreductase [Candidatus Dormibacteraeota bacterium]|nr:FAD-binding oxidoreductase [Candidatus Dormibacteraeota bacterium]